MLVQIEQLYINTDNIVTLSIYELKHDNNTDFGLIINNSKYLIYNVENKEEVLNLARTKTKNLVSILLRGMSINPIQRLQLEEEKNEK